MYIKVIASHVCHLFIFRDTEHMQCMFCICREKLHMTISQYVATSLVY